METLFLALRVAVALAAVLGVIWFVQRKLSGKGGKKPGLMSRLAPKRAIQVLGSHRLAAKASIAVVEIEGQKLVLGVTEHGISVLESAVPVSVAPAARDDEIIEPAPATGVPAQTFVAPQGPVPAPVVAPTPDFAAALRAAELEALEPTIDRSTLGSVITEGLRPAELAPAPRRSRGRVAVPDLDVNRAAAARPAARVAIPDVAAMSRPAAAPLATAAPAVSIPTTAPAAPSFAGAFATVAASAAIETSPALRATIAAEAEAASVVPSVSAPVARPASERVAPTPGAGPTRSTPTFLEALGPAFKQVVAGALGMPAPKSPVVPAAKAATAVPFASQLEVLRRAS